MLDEVMRCAQRCMLEVLEVPEAMRCVLLCMPEDVEDWLCLVKVLDVLDVIRCVLVCMLDALEPTVPGFDGAGDLIAAWQRFGRTEDGSDISL